MFNIKRRIESMGTIRFLCERAEQHALRDGQHEPGAEHFMLAAIDLPDGTAALTFEKLGMDAAFFREAIQGQYEEALRSIGLDPQAADRLLESKEAAKVRGGSYNASASGKAVMLALAADRKNHDPVLGAHVVAVIADMEHGVAARALQTMKIDQNELKRAAEDVARSFPLS